MFGEIARFLLNTIFTLFGAALILRVWMQAVRVPPYNPVTQAVLQATNWLVLPLRRVMPGGRHDWASLLGAFLIVLLSIIAILGFQSGFDFKLIFLVALERFFEWICYGFMATLIIEAVFSWVNPHAPLAPFVRALNDPLLRPLRRIIPPLGGVDLSPLVLLILLQIAVRVVSGLLFGGF